MKNILFCFLFSMFCYAIEDLGTVGNTYKIEEPNLRAEIQDGLDEINITKLRQQYLDLIDKKFTVNSTLPKSTKNETFTKENYIILDYDLTSYPNTILKKAGEKIYPNLPKGVSQNICFVDGSNDIIFNATIKKLKNCDTYMVANRDVRDLYPKFSYDILFPYDDFYEKRFDIKVLPTKLKIYDIYLDYTTIDMNELEQKLREKGEIL